jgi:hypothetical protein
VTAGNYEYFDTLQHTVYLVHQHYPDYHLIIYDLGLTKRQHKLVSIDTFFDIINSEYRVYGPNTVKQKKSTLNSDKKVNIDPNFKIFIALDRKKIRVD